VVRLRKIEVSRRYFEVLEKKLFQSIMGATLKRREGSERGRGTSFKGIKRSVAVGAAGAGHWLECGGVYQEMDLTGGWARPGPDVWNKDIGAVSL
jgi:hypothetical protein